MAACPECGLPLSRSVNGGRCPLCDRQNAANETTVGEVDLSEKTVPSAPAPEVTTKAAAPARTEPGSLGGFLTAIGEPPPTPQKVVPIPPPPLPAAAPTVISRPPVVAPPQVPIPGLNPPPMSQPKPAPAPAPAPSPPRPPTPSRASPSQAAISLGPKPLPPPAAFTAAVAAIPAPLPLVTAMEAVAPPPQPSPPALAAPSESIPVFFPATLPPDLPPATAPAALANIAPLDMESIDSSPVPDLVAGTAADADMPLELAAPAVPVRDRDTARPVPPRSPESTQAVPSRVPARRGIASPLAAAGVALGIAVGFLAGRFTSPSGVPIASTPAPVQSPTVVAAQVTVTPAAARTPVPDATPRATTRSSAAPAATSSAALSEALALLAAGKTDPAMAALQAIVKREPANADAHWALAGAFRAKRKGPQACPEYRAYTKHAPSGAHAAEAKQHLSICSAVTLLDQEKLDEAHAAFEAIVRKNKTFPDGYYWLGTMQALRNDNAAACASFLSYINLDSSGPYADRTTAQLGALGC